MLATGGRPVLVDEIALRQANSVARERTPGLTWTPPDPPDWPGCFALRQSAEVPDTENESPCCLPAFAAAKRRGRPHEELAGPRHPGLKDFSREDSFASSRSPVTSGSSRDRRNRDLLKDKTLLTAFYQPSTRTRLATEAAMHRLGGRSWGSPTRR